MANWIKLISSTILAIVLAFVLLLLSYVIHLSVDYYRIADNQTLEINNNQTTQVSKNETYKISTYNIGFGAYSQDFTFFMDSGTMKDGTKVYGELGKAKSKQYVLDNTNGAIETILNENCDFMFFQEVDTNSTRSYNVNQFEMITNNFTNYANTFAINFHSSYFLYPLNDPHGASNSGIATYSKYKIENSVRRSFPVDESFLAKFFDYDRCFSINRININNSDKQLVLINLHMSAYDEGGKIREKQLKMLNEVLQYEYSLGNYVIAGGDFNHDIANSVSLFPTEQQIPDWVYQLNNSDLAENFKFASSTNCPTCRAAEIVYEKGVNYSVVIDGFIVSSNITVTNKYNVDTDFRYSDHNPAIIEFILN